MTPIGAVLLVLVIMLLFGALPQTGLHNYGYLPAGTMTIVLIVVLLLLLFGRL